MIWIFNLYLTHWDKRVSLYARKT